MDLPTVQAKRLLKSANLNWLDKIYQGSIPSSAVDDTNTTLAVISEWLSEPGRYANSQFKDWIVGVEIQLFYKLNPQFNTLNAEINLARLFEDNGWNIEQSKNHIKDPETKQISKVFYLSKNIMLKKGE